MNIGLSPWSNLECWLGPRSGGEHPEKNLAKALPMTTATNPRTTLSTMLARAKMNERCWRRAKLLKLKVEKVA